MFLSSAHLLGILFKTPEEWFKSKTPEGLDEVQIEALIEKRQNARKNKDFVLADSIRKQLSDNGVILEDTPSGVRWTRG